MAQVARSGSILAGWVMRNIDSTYTALLWRGASFFLDRNWLRQIPANGERALVKLFEPDGVGWHAPRYSEGRDEVQDQGLRCNSDCATRPKEATKTDSCHCLYSSSAPDAREAALLEYKKWHNQGHLT
jgi:hypothetical protein